MVGRVSGISCALATMRPRVLYFAVFVFYSLTGGRFASTFLEHELGFSAKWISITMSIQLLVSNVCKPWLGKVADSWEASFHGGRGNTGRLRVMSLGLLLSTVAMLSHGLGRIINPTKKKYDFGDIETEDTNIQLPLYIYHVILRVFFVLGTGACGLALDGLTLAQLERQGIDKNNYGKERFYGALSWGISHVFLGPVVEFFGFSALYGTTVFAFVGCLIVIQMYSNADAPIQYAGVDSEVDIVESSAMEYQSNASPVCVSAKIFQPQSCKRMKKKTSFINDIIDIDVTNATNTKSLTLLELVRLLFQTGSLFKASFIMSLFALSIGMSVVESLIFLYFEFLGGSNIMCGMTVCVTVLFELPLFHYAPIILERLGSATMMHLGCLAYIVRAIGYSFIPQQHPYLVLFLEPLHGFTIGFAGTSSVAFADEWVPAGYESSGQGFISMIGGFGQFVGLCIGGYLEGRVLYRVLAMIVTLGSLILGIGKCWTAKPRYQQERRIDPSFLPVESLEMT